MKCVFTVIFYLLYRVIKPNKTTKGKGYGEMVSDLECSHSYFIDVIGLGTVRL